MTVMPRSGKADLGALDVTIPPEGLWATVRGPAGAQWELCDLLDGRAADLDVHHRGRPTYLLKGREMRVLVGALLDLRHQGLWPEGPQCRAWGELHAGQPDPLAPGEPLDVGLGRWVDDRLLWRHQAECLRKVLPAGRCLVDLTMGGGKTRLAAAIIAAAAWAGADNWLYVVTNQELAAQSELELRAEYPKLAAALPEPHTPRAPQGTPWWAPLRLACCSFAQLEDREGWRVDGVIVDEAHTLPPKTRSGPYARVAARFRIGMSGTAMDRQDADNALTVGLLGPVVCSVGAKELVADKRLAEGRVHMLAYNTKTGTLS